MRHHKTARVAALLFVTAFAGACSGTSAGPSGEAQEAYDAAMDLLINQGVDPAEAVLEGARGELQGGPDEALLLVGQSRVLSARGSHEEALAMLQDATERSPDLAEAHYFLSLAYFNGFMNEESLTAAARAVELDPDNADYLYQAAQMYDRTGRVTEAEASWERLLEMHPDDSRYLVPLAGLHHRLGDTALAIELLDRAATADPESQMGQMARQLSSQLRNEAQTSSELDRINTALKFAPQDAGLHHRRGELMLEARDYIGAEAALRNAISIEPEVAEHSALLSRVLDGKGEKEGAAAAMERAVELDPSSVDNALSLAGLWMQLGDLEKARAGLEKVIELAPESEQATFARDQLQRIQGGF